MNKRTKIIIGLSVLCLGSFVFAACSSDQSPYEDYAGNGYDFSVCYELNGGKASKADRIVHIYQSEEVQKGIKLYAPNNNTSGVTQNVERTGYFLAGWYAVRNARVNEQGQPLDEEGNLCDVETDLYDENGDPVYDENGNIQKTLVSAYGKAQGYSYAERWDFNTILQRDDFEYKNGEYAFTLYAAWVPNFTYEVNGQQHEWLCTVCGTAIYQDEKPAKCTGRITDEEGNSTPCTSTNFEDKGNVWHSVATTTLAMSYENGEPYFPDENKEIAIPQWDDTTGAMEYGDFPKPADLTFRAVYATGENCEQGVDPLSSITHHGSWDRETATATGNVARYYGSWENGLWYRISNEKQLIDNAGSNNSYHLLANLDFTDKEWPAAFSGYEYRGTFEGNNFTVSNVTVVQSSAEDSYGGLFGAIGENAAFENIIFSSVTFNLNAASRRQDSMFGLFAGALNEKATIVKVSVSGVLSVGDEVYVPSRQYDPLDNVWREMPCPYSVGLLTGNLVTGGISLSGITLKTGAQPAAVIDPVTGEIKIG